MLESCWFSLSSAANHMPMEVTMPDNKEDWTTIQVMAI